MIDQNGYLDIFLIYEFCHDFTFNWVLAMKKEFLDGLDHFVGLVILGLDL